MKYKKSPLDCFLQQRISDNAKELKNTLNETLQEEQDCLELIHGCIMHYTQNIVNKLGEVTSPIKELSINRLQTCFKY